MNQPALTLRDLQPEDAELLVRYWKEATDQDLERMGELKRPDAQESTAFIHQLCKERPHPSVAGEAILIWCHGGQPIGYSTLKAIQFQKEAQIHLHLWERDLRGKGLGGVLFCLAALRFIEQFELKTLYCQPKHDNPCPNGMLRKIGFPLIGTVHFQRRDSTVIKQNRYLIQKETAEEHLRKHP